MAPGLSLVQAAGRSDPGKLRENNEDRFHSDPARGIFIVVDGVGGHAAGDQAADTAIKMLRARLERETGTVEDRVREAITVANNEIHRLASLKDEWRGMSCVLTIAVLDAGQVVVGHVGDTRLYKIRGDRIQKITRDHSPVGEREDAGEISEQEAMQHPRRNEVFRDVGSAAKLAFDHDFIDVARVPFEPDSALLLCTDGLTDLITSAQIMDAVRAHAGRPQDVTAALIRAANEAGGKDNVTVVYAEGRQFATGADTGPMTSPPREAKPATAPRERRQSAPASHDEPAGMSMGVVAAILLSLALLGAGAYYAWSQGWWTAPAVLSTGQGAPPVVRAGGSITQAIAAARDGAEIAIEPGVYRERLIITKNVRLRSTSIRGATLRLPAGASESDIAVSISNGAQVALSGFRILGDATSPLGTGISVGNAALTLHDTEIAGASGAALEFGADSTGSVVGADVHDNPGAAILVRAGAAPRIVHSQFIRNATSTATGPAVVIDSGSKSVFSGNVFLDVRPDQAPGIDPLANWFVQRTAPPRPTPGRTRR